jgi:hypothetical protein
MGNLQIMGFTLLKTLYVEIVKKCFKKQATILVLFVVVFNYSNAQDLDYSNENLESDSARGQWAYQKFIDRVTQGDYDSAIYFAELTNDIALNIADSLLFVRSGYALGFTYKQLGLYKQSIYYLNQSKDWAIQHSDNQVYQDRLKLTCDQLPVKRTHVPFYDNNGAWKATVFATPPTQDSSGIIIAFNESTGGSNYW